MGWEAKDEMDFFLNSCSSTFKILLELQSWCGVGVTTSQSCRYYPTEMPNPGIQRNTYGELFLH